MEYHEFVCTGTPTIFLATANPAADRIPGAAKGYCREWAYARAFQLGDGSHAPALDEAIRARVAIDGYHIYLIRPDHDRLYRLELSSARPTIR